MKTPTRGRFAPLAQVPPIAFLFSFSFLFTLNLNYEKILPYLYFTPPLSKVDFAAFSGRLGSFSDRFSCFLHRFFRFFGVVVVATLFSSSSWSSSQRRRRHPRRRRRLDLKIAGYKIKDSRLKVSDKLLIYSSFLFSFRRDFVQ